MQQLRTFLIQDIPADVSFFELYSGSDVNNLQLVKTNIIPDKYGIVKIKINEYRRAPSIYYKWAVVDVFGNRSELSEAGVIDMDDDRLFDQFVLQEIGPDLKVNILETANTVKLVGQLPTTGFRRYRAGIKKVNSELTSFSDEQIIHSNQTDSTALHAVYLQVQPEKIYPGEKIRIFWRVEGSLEAEIDPNTSFNTYSKLLTSPTPVNLTGVIEDFAPSNPGTYTLTIKSIGLAETKTATTSFEVLTNNNFAPLSVTNPTHSWTFNDSSGNTAIDEADSEDLTIQGSPVWGQDYLDLLTFNNTTPYFETTTSDPDYWGHIQTFSIVTWIELLKDHTNAGSEEVFLTIGNGLNDLNNWNFYAGSMPGNKIKAVISKGIFAGPGTLVSSNLTYNIGDKLLVIVTYKYNSTNDDNELVLMITKDGTNWDTASSNTAVPLSLKTGYQLRSAFINASYHNGNWRHYKTDFYKDYVITTNDAQAVWNGGSESNPVLAFEFNADNYQIEDGDTVTLSWDIPNGSDAYLDNGVGQVPTTGDITLSPNTDTTYTLIAHFPDGVKAERSLEVKVTPVPIINRFVAEKMIIDSGESLNLVWAVSNANYIEITPGIGVVLDTQENVDNVVDNISIQPTTNTTYTLTASSKDGIIKSTTFDVVVENVHQIDYFTMDGGLLKIQGEITNFSYSVLNADSVTITGPDGFILGPTTVLSDSFTITNLAGNTPIFEREVTYKLTAEKDGEEISQSIIFTISTEPPEITNIGFSGATTDLSSIPLIFDYKLIDKVTLEMLNGDSPNPDIITLAYQRDGSIVSSGTQSIDFTGVVNSIDYNNGSSVKFKLTAFGPAGKISKEVVFDNTGLISVS